MNDRLIVVVPAGSLPGLFLSDLQTALISQAQIIAGEETSVEVQVVEDKDELEGRTMATYLTHLPYEDKVERFAEFREQYPALMSHYGTFSGHTVELATISRLD